MRTISTHLLSVGSPSPTYRLPLSPLSIAISRSWLARTTTYHNGRSTCQTQHGFIVDVPILPRDSILMDGSEPGPNARSGATISYHPNRQISTPLFPPLHTSLPLQLSHNLTTLFFSLLIDSLDSEPLDSNILIATAYGIWRKSPSLHPPSSSTTAIPRSTLIVRPSHQLIPCWTEHSRNQMRGSEGNIQDASRRRMASPSKRKVETVWKDHKQPTGEWVDV